MKSIKEKLKVGEGRFKSCNTHLTKVPGGNKFLELKKDMSLFIERAPHGFHGNSNNMGVKRVKRRK